MKRFDVSTIIGAPPSRVWEVITSPELVKRYMPGTEVTTDWKVGSPIRWKGVLQDKVYESKGTITKVIPEQLLEYTYFSSTWRVEDAPGNYFTITYLLEKEREGTTVTLVVQGNILYDEMEDELKLGWKTALSRLATAAEELQ